MKKHFALLTLLSSLLLFGSCLRTRTENIAYFDQHLTQADTTSALWLNEFCARGAAYPDELNPSSPDHWMEIYNKTSSPIALDTANYYLSGDSTLTVGGMYKLNTFTIPAHGYIVVFGDDSNKTTNLHMHANFHVSKQGGFIGLYHNNTTNHVLTTINSIDYDSIAVSGSSWGVYPDGSPNWNQYTIPSPGLANPHP